MHFIFWNKRSLFSSMIKSALLFALFTQSATNLFSDEEVAKLDLKDAAIFNLKKSDADADGFTINYNNVSIVEYLKFVTKICNVNFLFNEADLNFNVTVVSEDPITPESVMATLIQILRIRGFSILEQDKSLVIHNSPDVKQFAKLVFDGEPIDKSYPIITKVFRLSELKVDAVASIIRPMLSTEAVLDISPETQVLILTDITANVEKVGLLIENLQSPQKAITIEPYKVKFNEPNFLITMASQIMAPMSQGHPFIMVAQSKANSIFIVSTPSLVEKAITVLTNLDTAPEKEKNVPKELKPQNIFIYKIVYRSISEITKGLHEIAQNIQASGYSEKGMIQSIDNVKAIKETNSLLFTGDAETLNKLREILSALDVATKEQTSDAKESFFMYKPQQRNVHDINEALKEVEENLKRSGMGDKALLETLASAKVVPTTQSVVFTGDPATFAKVKEILASVDVPSKSAGAGKPTFFIYQIKNVPDDQLQNSLHEFAKNIEKSGVSEESLTSAIDNMKFMKESNSLMFTADEKTLKRIQDILPSFDQELLNQKVQQKKMAERSQFFVYKPKFLKGEEISKSLADVENNLKESGLADPQLIRSLNSMKWVKTTNSLLFTGDPASLQKVEGLIQNIDVPTVIKPGHERTFLIYQLQYAPRDKMEQYLNQVADNLKKKGLKEEDLIETISSSKWIPESHSFMFSGTQTSLARLKELLASYDIPAERAIAASQPSFILYQLEYTSKEQMEEYLKQIAQNLNRTDEKQNNLYKAIYSLKWIEPSHSFMFSGTKDALNNLQVMTKEFDTPAHRAAEKAAQTYFVYKLVNVSGDVIEEDLDKFAKKMQSSSASNKKVLQVIDNINWIKETNSLLLTGDSKAIEEVKELIVQYDVKRDKGSEFFMYKPQHVTPDYLEKSLKDLGENLKKADLADPALLNAIASARYNDSTQAVIFTGNTASLQKIEGLIKEIDVVSSKNIPIQHIGKTTFFLYKLKAASGPQIVKSLQSFTDDLKKSGTSDKDFLTALASMRFIRETNSLLFTGTEQALEKVKPLVDKFDVPELGSKTVEGPSNFFMYKPQYMPGPELEKSLTDFVDHLKDSGLSNPGLYQATHSARWVEKSGALVFTGDEKSLAQVKDLLQNFDIPNKASLAPSDSSIQSVDNTSFLVYKLQYHKGDEIQGALRQIGSDLLQNSSTVNKSLLNAIHSIQWLQVTNSLLCSGDQETLTRLKELIKNLDVPLKQVFIDVLVIQTSLSNVLNFGLNWGSKFKVSDKFAGSTGNFNTTTNATALGQGIAATNATSFPSPTAINFEQNFDLGVIGDIIMHKGKSFISLGSLMQALQTDTDTSVLMNPKLISQDNKTSSVFIGLNIPFVGSFLQNITTNTLNTTNLEYRDIGMNLTITPVLGNSDVVTLDIELDNTSVPTDVNGQQTNVSVGGVQGITTSKTTMSTTVHVPNESFLVLSGMVDTSKIRQKTGIPCLGGIPFIGAALSSLSTSDTRSNIVIFMRPHIINSYEDMKRVTQDQEDLFREQAGSGFLESEFDEGMELIKSIDDE
jgi:type III secretion protein C